MKHPVPEEKAPRPAANRDTGKESRRPKASASADTGKDHFDDDRPPEDLQDQQADAECAAHPIAPSTATAQPPRHGPKPPAAGKGDFGRHAPLQPGAEESAKVILATEMFFGAKGGIETLAPEDFPTPQLQQIARFVRDTNGCHYGDVVLAVIASDLSGDDKQILRNSVLEIGEFPQANTEELLGPHLKRLREFIDLREEQFEEWRANPAQAGIMHQGLIGYQNTDAGNADRLHAAHGKNIRYISSSGQWLTWDKSRWVPDSTGHIVRMFIETMRSTARLAADIRDPKEAQAIMGFALRSTNKPSVDAGIALARSVKGTSISITDLDSDPWMIGCVNGVINLRSGEYVKPERGQLITKSIGTKYDPKATCPTWLRFLETVTNGDAELIGFLQAAVGYTLTGLTSEQCLFFLHGTGQNGKGVFSETIKRMSGDYGQTAPESLFTKDKPTGATNDIARLAGCRMAVASELDEGASFAESRIKSLTGGDTITARFLNREFFDFLPTHKFWISGNHKPTVKGTDFGIWRRIRLIPFTVRIPEAEKDPNLTAKLADELPGILNWAIEGCQRWQREGLCVPQCVKQATESYRLEEDVVGQFLTDCTEEQAGARTLTNSVYDAYGQWAGREGIQERHRLSARRLIRRIEEHGFHRMKSHGVPMWENLTLKPA
ncbi:MAG: phage/plasmid primase, P4 family [Verrucomicrobiota bacterium]